MGQCGNDCEVYARVVGYYRPVEQWNPGKQEEFKDRLSYAIQEVIPFGISAPDDSMLRGLQQAV